MDPIEIDDQAPSPQSPSPEGGLGSIPKLALEQSRKELDSYPRSDVDLPALFGWRPMKGPDRRAEKDDPQPEAAAEVERTMTFTRWSAQRQQQGYPSRRFKS
jgi:hypothetical protein